jgi:hypothetical protein
MLPHWGPGWGAHPFPPGLRQGDGSQRQIEGGRGTDVGPGALMRSQQQGIGSDSGAQQARGMNIEGQLSNSKLKQAPLTLTTKL